MEADARYTYVGAAVLALLAALVAAVVWLKDVGGRDEFRLYAIHFERQSLDGLEVGAQVSLRGIKVGRVEDYALADERLNRVRVVVRVDRRAPVRTNTVAVVTRNIVTGIASIALVNREPAGEPLTQVASGESYPVIGEGQSDLDEIAGRVHQMGEQASNALTNINQLLTADNRRDVMDTVRSLRELMTGLNRRLGALDRTLERSGAAANSIAGAAKRLGDAGDRVAAAVDRAGTQLAAAGDRAVAVGERAGVRLDAALVQTEQMVLDTRNALARVLASVEAVERQAVQSTRQLESSVAGIDDNVAAAVSELRLSVAAATRVLDRLRDPRAALLGPGKAQLGPGEAAP